MTDDLLDWLIIATCVLMLVFLVAMFGIIAANLFLTLITNVGACSS